MTMAVGGLGLLLLALFLVLGVVFAAILRLFVAIVSGAVGLLRLIAGPARPRGLLPPRASWPPSADPMFDRWLDG